MLSHNETAWEVGGQGVSTQNRDMSMMHSGTAIREHNSSARR